MNGSHAPTILFVKRVEACSQTFSDGTRTRCTRRAGCFPFNPAVFSPSDESDSSGSLASSGRVEGGQCSARRAGGRMCPSYFGCILQCAIFAQGAVFRVLVRFRHCIQSLRVELWDGEHSVDSRDWRKTSCTTTTAGHGLTPTGAEFWCSCLLHQFTQVTSTKSTLGLAHA